MIKRYLRFIESRRHRTIEDRIYTETHHILPKSWGGLDIEENMIKLTAREHFIAHKMLAREFPQDCSMTKAFHMMCNCTSALSNKREYEITSRDFELAKELYSKTLIGRESNFKGKHHSDESKQKLSKSTKSLWEDPKYRENAINKMVGREPWNKGMKMSEEFCEINRIAQKKAWESTELRKRQSESHKGQISPMKGKCHTQESKERNRQRHLNKGDNYLCVETDVVIHNKYELIEFLGKENVSLTNVRRATDGRLKTAYGYHWVVTESEV